MNAFSDFLNGADFERHVQETILQYQKALCAIDLKKFNSNIIDPIKLTFDRAVFQKSMQQLIEDEISRQRDKTATNVIGYFHQNIFRYFPNCVVPREGWDVIVTQKDGTKIYVEMKNKHNTMNAASSQKTYIQMQNQIMQTPDDFCFLVEAIAPCSRNIPWGCSVNKTHCEHAHIRRVSMDQFYAIVTGEATAFFEMCMQLPRTIEKIVKQNKNLTVQKDTVLEELQQMHPDLQIALYQLAFATYDGFSLLK